MSNLEHLLPELAKHCDKPVVELDMKKLKHLIDNFDNAMLDMEPKTALSSAVRIINYLKEVLK